MTASLSVVTGATGHLGTALVRMLCDAGPHVRYIARPGSASRGLADTGAQRSESELHDVERLAEAMSGASVVYHAAGLISLVASDRDQLHRVNVEGTQTVLTAAVRAGVPRFVHVGSVEAFPLAGGRSPITEDHGVDPTHTILEYGRTKALGILHVLSAPTGETEVVVCCPSGLIGPPDYRGSEAGRVIVDFLNRRLPAYVNGGFDFVDVRDAAAGLIAASRRGRAGSIYLLAGSYVSIPQMMELLEQESGVPKPRVCLPVGLALPVAPVAEAIARLRGRRPWFTRGSLRIVSLGVQLDSSRARDELGYTTRPIRETIADAVAWYRDHDLTVAAG